jgi:protein-S-isoprenylcysteine O-methyltransferase Ste14
VTLKATRFELRFRFWILLAVFALGFLAPWNYVLHLDGAGPNTHLWGQLAILLSRGGMGISAAFNAVLTIGIALAFAGAVLRTLASAYPAPELTRGEAQGDTLIADGPYRFLRHPPTLGLWLNALALALLMPPTGAAFTLTALVLLQLRLVLAEEASLSARFGQAYLDYCARVPRFLPAPRPRITGSGTRPRWGHAALAEIFLWGTAISFAAFGWQYNAHLLIQCVLVSLGVALVARGVTLPAAAPAQ